MDTALQVVVAGLTNGAVYGISALGIVVVYRVARIVNLAQGEAITIGALGTWWLDQQQGWPRPLAAIATVAGAALFYAVLSWLSLLRAGTVARGGPTALPATLPASLVTLALALLVQGVVFAQFGRELYGSPPLVGWEPLRVGQAVLPAHTVVVVIVTAGLAAALSAIGTVDDVGAGHGRLRGEPVRCLCHRRRRDPHDRRGFCRSRVARRAGRAMLAPVTVFSYLTGFGFALHGLAAAAPVGFQSPGAGLWPASPSESSKRQSAPTSCRAIKNRWWRRFSLPR